MSGNGKISVRSIFNQIVRMARKNLNRSKYLFARQENPVLRAFVHEVVNDCGQPRLTGHVYANFAVTNLKIVVRKFREEQIQFEGAVELKSIGGVFGFLSAALGLALGVRCYRFSACSIAPWDRLPSSIYSLALQSNGARSRTIFPDIIKQTIVHEEKNYTLFVFNDPVVRAARIEHYRFGTEGLDQLKRYAGGSRPPELSCVIAEYTTSARDNGIALFRHIEANEPDIRATYVVERLNLDNFAVDGDRVVEFGTLEHLKRCLDAQVVAFSHHRAYAYPMILRSINEQRYDSTRTVFLQHGITAMKRSVQKFYHQRRCGYTAVSVCSELERRIFRKAFGYGSAQVYVTGFPRHDALYLAASNRKREESLLVFPTWRSGLEKMDSQEAAGTLFVAQWRAALSVLRASGLQVKFMLHPIIHRHAALFQDYCDVIVPAGHFQPELLRSSCLVTDYSSVSFDALFAGIPVVMFQFDIEDYGLKHSAFVDVEKQLPGLPVYNPEDVLATVMELQRGGWRVGEEQHQGLYFSRRDALNGARVSTVIKALSLTSG